MPLNGLSVVELLVIGAPYSMSQAGDEPSSPVPKTNTKIGMAKSFERQCVVK